MKSLQHARNYDAAEEVGDRLSMRVLAEQMGEVLL